MVRHPTLVTGCPPRGAPDAASGPVGITSLRRALGHEGVAGDGGLITGTWVRGLARPHLECRGLGVDAGLAEADDRVPDVWL
jgi:hypothetical protein